MSSATSRLRPGAKVIAQVDHFPEILYDMSLTAEDGSLIKDIEMIGTVVRVTNTHVTCKLSAAEETLHVPLSMVQRCPETVSAPIYYVVVNETIKEVKDLLIPVGAQLPDYHKTREDANKELAEIIAKNPRPTVTDETVSTAQRMDLSTPATQVPPPATPVPQQTRSTRRRRPGGRARKRKKKSSETPNEAENTASETANESQDTSEVS